jgi:hypothetical protein
MAKRHLKHLTVEQQLKFYRDFKNNLKKFVQVDEISPQEKAKENELLKAPEPKTKRQKDARKCLSLKTKKYNCGSYIEIFPKFNPDTKTFLEKGVAWVTVKIPVKVKNSPKEKATILKPFSLGFYLWDGIEEKIVSLVRFLDTVLSEEFRDFEGNRMYIHRTKPSFVGKHDYYFASNQNHQEKIFFVTKDCLNLAESKVQDDVLSILSQRQHYVASKLESVDDIGNIIHKITDVDATKMLPITEI